MYFLGDLYYCCKWCKPADKPRSCAQAGRTALVNHAKSEMHMSSAKTKAITTDVSKFFHNAASSMNEANEVSLKIAAFVVTNNLPIAISDELTELIKSIKCKPETMRQVTCDRTKCTQLIRNVTGAENLELLLGQMRNNYFSLIIDESTDISTSKHLVLCVRLHTKDRVTDKFLALLEVN